MKLNWGTGIVIAFIAFIGFIMYFVINMNTNDKYDHDLVTEDYYAQELIYQQEIDAEKNLQLLSQEIKGRKTNEGWLLEFPQEIESEKIEGTVFLYRPSNEHLDFDFP